MKRDNYVESRLKEWAVWYHRIVGEGLGFPSQSAFSVMRHNKARGSVDLYDNPDAEEVEKIINHMLIHKQTWATIIRMEYCGINRSVKDKARLVGIQREKWYEFLNLAKTYIEGRLGV